MSGAVKLVEKKRVLLESIDTGNGPNKTIDEIRKTEMGADLHKLKLIRKAHLNNPIIGYLNLNSLRNKIHEVCEVFGDLSLDYFVLGADLMESYGEWRVTVYDVIFGEIRFLDSHLNIGIITETKFKRVSR